MTRRFQKEETGGTVIKSSKAQTDQNGLSWLDSSFSVHTHFHESIFMCAVFVRLKALQTQHVMFACEWKQYSECHITYLFVQNCGAPPVSCK